MSFELNAKLRDIQPYVVESCDDCLRLDANESFISLPDSLREKIADAVRGLDFNRYPDPSAAGLCAAFADYYGISPELVCAGNGSDELLYIISTCFTSNADTVVSTSPDFSMYRFYSYLAECRQVVYNKVDLEIDPQALIDLCKKEAAKLLIFSNPCNPTGRGLDRDAVRKIIQGVDCLVVLDEAYMDFWNQSLIDEVAAYPNVILLKTMSKAIGAAALRLGFAVANPTIIRALRAAKSPYNVNSISQTAGELLLRQKDYLMESTAKIITNKCDLYLNILPICEKNGWKLRPSYTNFVYIEAQDAAQVYDALKAQGILVRRFENALRITTGSRQENAALIQALKAYPCTNVKG